MEGQSVTAGGGCGKEMALYVCWGGFVEKGAGGRKDCV